MSSHKPSCGFSLVEVLVTMGVLSVTAVTSGMFLTQQAKQFLRMDQKQTAERFSENLELYIRNQRSWAKTLADPENTALACLKNHTDCREAPARPMYFKLVNSIGEVVVDSRLVREPAADDQHEKVALHDFFDSQGVRCDRYFLVPKDSSLDLNSSSLSSGSACRRLAVTLEVSPECPNDTAEPCVDPIIHVIGKIYRRSYSETPDPNRTVASADDQLINRFDVVRSATGEEIPPDGSNKGISFDIQSANTTQWKCMEKIDVQEYCAGGMGCEVIFRMQHKAYYDQVKNITYQMYLEEPTYSNNTFAGIYGNMGWPVDTNFLLNWTQRYTLASPWNWAYMLNYTHQYCPTPVHAVNVPYTGYNVSFLVHPSVKAKITIQKRAY